MVELMIVEVMIKAAILCGILWLVARHEADLSFSKVAMVIAGITFLDVLIQALLTPHIGNFAFLAVCLMVVAMIQTFCWVSWPKAIATTAIFMAFNIIIALIGQQIMAGIGQAMQSPMEANVRRTERIQNEILSTFDESLPQIAPGAPGDTPNAPLPAVVPDLQPEDVVTPTPPVDTAPPSAATTADLPDDWKDARRQIKAEGFISDGSGGFVVRINGKQYQKGDRLTTAHKGQTYRWRVQAVDRREIDLVPLQ